VICQVRKLAHCEPKETSPFVASLVAANSTIISARSFSVSEPEPPGASQLDVELIRQNDAVCRRFETDCRAGARPPFDLYLAEVPDRARPALRAELETMERELRQPRATVAREQPCSTSEAPTMTPAEPPTRPIPGEARRTRISILELMGLVSAAAICFRWPGLSIPVVCVYAYVLAWRRDFPARPTRAAIGQVALALYLPTTLGLFWAPLWWWETYASYVSLLPSLFPAAFILSAVTGINVRYGSPAGTIGMVLLSLFPPILIVGVGLVARRGRFWRIAGLVFAAGMSVFSLLVFIVLMSIPT
jgi:hypothetical protein